MMDVIVSGRQFGKTKRLIEMSARDGLVIVTANSVQAELVKIRAREEGLEIPDPVPWALARTATKELSARGVVVDDVDVIVQAHFAQPVRAVTLTGYLGLASRDRRAFS